MYTQKTDLFFSDLSRQGSSNSLRRSQFGGSGGGYTPKRTPSFATLSQHQQATQLPDSQVFDVDSGLPPPPVLAAQQRAREQEAAEAREAQQWRQQTDAILSDLNAKLELVVARLEHPVAPPPPPPPAPAASESVPATLPVELEEQKQLIASIATQLGRIETEIKRSRRETKRLKTAVAEQAAATTAAATAAASAASPGAPEPAVHTQVDMELFSGTVQQNMEEVVGRSERKMQRQLAEMEVRLQEFLLRRSPSQGHHHHHHHQSSTAAPVRPTAAQMAAPALPSPFVQPYGVSPAAKSAKAEHRKRKSRGNSSQGDITQFRKALFRQLLTREQ